MPSAVHNFCTSQKAVNSSPQTLQNTGAVHRGGLSSSNLLRCRIYWYIYLCFLAHLLGEDLYNNLIGYLSRHLGTLKNVGLEIPLCRIMVLLKFRIRILVPMRMKHFSLSTFGNGTDILLLLNISTICSGTWTGTGWSEKWMKARRTSMMFTRYVFLQGWDVYPDGWP